MEQAIIYCLVGCDEMSLSFCCCIFGCRRRLMALGISLSDVWTDLG